uniref:DUF834 domain-containing protein n=1 Tax=Setaria viridis TaxID=4556 RepID=A0A4U6VDL1_SETVI|nr:hypothetical protein SEVIR_3G213800v2 [Setaria viridis]
MASGVQSTASTSRESLELLEVGGARTRGPSRISDLDQAVPLVATVAGAAEYVPLAAAAGAGGGEGRGGGDDAAELAGLVEAPDLLGAAEVAAADEDLGQRHAAALRVGEQRRELGEEGGVHGEVPLVDGGAEPPQDGPHGAAVLVGAADHAERGEVEDHPPAAAPAGGGGVVLPSAAVGGRGRGLLERAEDPERGGGDADAVEDARRRGGGGGARGRRGGVRREQRPEVLEGRGWEGEARGRDERGGGGGGRGGVGAARLDPRRRPHGRDWGGDAGSASGRREWEGEVCAVPPCAGLLRLCVVVVSAG